MTREAEIKFSSLSADEALRLAQYYRELMLLRVEFGGLEQPEVERTFRPTATHSVEDVEDETVDYDVTSPAAVDSVGIAWREDTHSSSRRLTSAGAWALRRGCPENLAADYRRRFAAATGTTPKPAAPAPAPTPDQLNQKFAAPPVTAAPPAPVAPPSVDYQSWYNLYVALANGGRFEGQDAWITQMNQACGVSTMGEYQSNDRARALSYGMLLHFQG